MKYYSEETLRDYINLFELEHFLERHNNEAINIRLCRECEYFERNHPTIETDGDFGYCTYKTDFMVLDNEPINWYFTDINGFCNEEDLK